MIENRHRFIFDGDVIEADYVIATEAEWARSPESASDRWSVVRSRGKVYACSITLPTSLLRPRRRVFP